jgi:hypothetical protein
LLERSAVINASAFISVSEGTNETIRSRYPTISSHFTAIPYGFEPNDFAAVRQQEQSSKYLAHFRDNLNFCYVGAMLPKAYDTVRALFRAVAQLRASSHEAERIRLHFFGTTYATGAAAKPLVLSVAEEEGIADVVTEHPERIPYLEALRVLVSADMVLALGSSETHYTASKIFPNLLARRPLLAMFHEASSVCDIIRLARTGHLITFNDRQPVGTKVDKIADAIGSFLQGDSIGLDELGVEEVSQRFSAREMTRLLADVLNKAISSQPNDLMEGVLTEGGIS